MNICFDLLLHSGKNSDRSKTLTERKKIRLKRIQKLDKYEKYIK